MPFDDTFNPAEAAKRLLYPDKYKTPPSDDVSDLLERMRGGTLQQESGGNYQARNQRTGALGGFQVMPANIPSWTKAYLGRAYNPDEFARDPNAQESVFKGEMGKYLRKARRLAPDDDTAIRMAAAAWYGGEGAMNRYDDPTRFRPDEPSFREYTQSVLRRSKPIKFNAQAAADKLLNTPQEFDPNAAAQSLLDSFLPQSNDAYQSKPVQQRPLPTGINPAEIISQPVPETRQTQDLQIEAARNPNVNSRMGVLLNPQEVPDARDPKWQGFQAFKYDPERFIMVNTAQAKKAKLRNAKDIQQFLDVNKPAANKLFLGIVDTVDSTGGGQPVVTAQIGGKEAASAVVTDEKKAQHQADVYREQFPQAEIGLTTTDGIVTQRQADEQPDMPAAPEQVATDADFLAANEYLKSVGQPELTREQFNAAQKGNFQAQATEYQTKPELPPQQAQGRGQASVPRRTETQSAAPALTASQGGVARPTSEGLSLEIGLTDKPANQTYTEWVKGKTASGLAEKLGVSYNAVRRTMAKFPTTVGQSKNMVDEDYYARLIQQGDESTLLQVGSNVIQEAKRQDAAEKEATTKLTASREKLLASNPNLDVSPEMLDVMAAQDAGLLGKNESDKKLLQARNDYIDWLVNNGYAEESAIKKAFGIKESTEPISAAEWAWKSNPVANLLGLGIENKSQIPQQIKSGITKDILEYGSLAEANKAYKKQQEQRKFSESSGLGFGQPTEALKTAARYIAKIPSTLLETGAILNDVNLVESAYRAITGRESNIRPALMDAAKGWRETVDADKVLGQNAAYRNDWIVNEGAEAFAQLGVQLAGGALTGGATLALPLAEGATAQYREADEAGAGQAVRLTVAAAGAALAVPDLLLKAKYLRGLSGAGRFKFIESLTSRLYAKFAQQATPELAKEATELTVKAFVRSLAKNVPIGTLGEQQQERWEDVGNKALKKALYKPSVTWEDILVPTAAEKRGYWAAGLAGAGGGTVETVIQRMSDTELARGQEVLSEMLANRRIKETDFNRFVARMKREQQIRAKVAPYFAADAQIQSEVQAETTEPDIFKDLGTNEKGEATYKGETLKDIEERRDFPNRLQNLKPVNLRNLAESKGIQVADNAFDGLSEDERREIAVSMYNDTFQPKGKDAAPEPQEKGFEVVADENVARVTLPEGYKIGDTYVRDGKEYTIEGEPNPETGIFDVTFVGANGKTIKTKGFIDFLEAPASDVSATPAKPLPRGDAARELPEVETTGEVGNDARVVKSRPRKDAKPAPQEPQAKPKTPPLQPTVSADQFQDYGEKIGGAKKDLARSLDAVTDDALLTQPLSKVFPRPNFAKLIADKSVSLDGAKILSFLYDNIPAKPRKSWKVKGWADNVNQAVAIYKDVLGPNPDAAQVFLNLARKSKITTLADQFDIYSAWLDATGFPDKSVSMQGYEIKLFRDGYGGNNTGQDEYLIVRNGLIKGRYGSAQGAAKALLAKLQTPTQTVFNIYQDRTTKDYFIGKKGASGVVRLITGLESAQAARTRLAENQTQLERMWEALKFKKGVERRDTGDEVREAKDWRNGKDITSTEEFAKTFGFRGVEFGNWVKQGASKNERQQAINDSFDALMDLADLLNIDPRAISLNGELALALGARGSGDASAHYEPGKVVINLTKTRGKGSLGHEWWHALDNHFGKRRGEKGGFVTDFPRVRKIRDSGMFIDDPSLRVELLKGYENVVQAIKDSELPKRSRRMDATRSTPYWSTIVEMSARSFENYIITRLGEKGQRSDFLANFRDMADWGKAGFDADAFPYPIASEQDAINQSFDKLFAAMEQAEQDGNVTLFHKLEVTNEMRDVAKRYTDDLFKVAKFSRHGAQITAVNLETYGVMRQLINTALGEDSDFGGTILEGEQIDKVRQVMADIDTSTWTLRAKGNLKKFASEFDKAAKHKKKPIVSFILIPDAITEEAVHGAFYQTVAENTIEKWQSPEFVKQVLASPLYKATTVEENYGDRTDAIKAHEFIAKILAGKWTDLGIDPDAHKAEILQTLRDWKEDYEKVHGKFDETEFRTASEMAEYFFAAVESQSKGADKQESDSDENTVKREPDGEAAGRAGVESDKASDVGFEPGGKVKKSKTPETLRGNLDLPVKDVDYTSTTNLERKTLADKQLAKGLDKAEAWVQDQIADENNNHGATVTVGIGVANQLGVNGEIDRMDAIVRKLIPTITDAAQTVQAVSTASMWNPEAAATYAAMAKLKRLGKKLSTDEARDAVDIAKAMHNNIVKGGMNAAQLAELENKLATIVNEKNDLQAALDLAEGRLTETQLDLEAANKQIKELTEDKPKGIRVKKDVRKYIRDIRARKAEIDARLSARYRVSDSSILQMAIRQAPEVDQDLVDETALELYDNFATKNDEQIKQFIHEKTNGLLSDLEVDAVHAAALYTLKGEPVVLTPEEKLARQEVNKGNSNRLSHYRAARQYEMSLLTSDPSELMKGQGKRNKFIDYILVTGKENFTPESIFTALARQSIKNENDVIKALQKEYPDLSPDQRREALRDGEILIRQSRVALRNDNIQKQTNEKLTQQQIDLIRQDQINVMNSRRDISRTAKNFYDGLLKTRGQITIESLVNFRRANLLTGVKTHGQNIVGNVIFAVTEEITRPVAAFADMAASFFTNEKTIQGWSPTALYRSFRNIIKEDGTLKASGRKSGVQAAADIWYYGGSVEDMERLQHSESILHHAYKGTKLEKPARWFDTYVNKVYRTLGGEDALFKVFAFRRAMEEMTYRQAKSEGGDVKKRQQELLANPPRVMIEQADDFAQFMIFQNDNAFSTVIRQVKNTHYSIKAGIETLMPYDRTPTNLFIRALEYAPGTGLVATAYKAARIPLGVQKIATHRGFKTDVHWRARYSEAVKEDNKATLNKMSKAEQAAFVEKELNKLWTRKQQADFARTFGRMLPGNALFALGVFLAINGLLTGSMSPDDDDPKERDEFFDRRKRGIENRSLYIPKVGRFVLPKSPPMDAVVAGATFYEQMPMSKGDAIMGIMNGASESFEDMLFEQPLFRSTGDLARTLKKGKYGEFAGNLAGGYVPASAMVRDISEVLDPKARSASGYDPSDPAKTSGGKLRQNLRGFRNSALRGIPIVRNYAVPENLNTVSDEERGAWWRRAVRAIDILNTRSPDPYEVKRPARKGSMDDYLKSPEFKRSTTDDLVYDIQTMEDVENRPKMIEALRKKAANAREAGTLTKKEADAINALPEFEKSPVMPRDTKGKKVGGEVKDKPQKPKKSGFEKSKSGFEGGFRSFR